MTMSEREFSEGSLVVILPGTMAELIRRGWHQVELAAGCDGKLARVSRHYHKGKADEHYDVELWDGGSLGVPPNCLVAVVADHLEWANG
jgi:hypothetical protein